MAFEDAKKSIEKMGEVFRGGFGPDWGDLENLYNLMMETKPRISVEFGSGFSTCVMFQAVDDIGWGNVLSLESDPMFYSGISHFLFTEGLVDMPTTFKPTGIGKYYLFSNVSTISGTHVRYDYVPITYADFVYVDGPSLIGMQRDLANIEDFSPPPKTVLVDGRPVVCRSLAARWDGLYDIEREDDELRTTFRMKDEYRSALLHIDYGKGWYQKEGWA